MPGEDLIVDKQLFPFRGRCKFIIYMPSKPAKYGLKTWWINDAKSFYPYPGQLYTGLPHPENVIRDLVINYFKRTGRNITCDNFFTTFDLAQHLMKNHLSILGTVNKKRRFIPSEMLANRSREVLSTTFAHSENVVVCSYVPKRKTKL